MITVFESEKLRLSHLPGGTGLGVVAFTGVGLALGGIEPRDIQREEFRKSLQGENCHVIFVIDKQRSWYADPEVVRPAVLGVNAIRREYGLTRLVTLGNSMGGAGALYLGGLVDADLALAFAPQSSVCRSAAPFERRYDPYLDCLPSGVRHVDFAKAVRPPEAVLFYGLNCIEDNLHALRFMDAGLAPVFLRSGDHNVVAVLKREGHLKPLIAAALQGGAEQVGSYVRDNVPALDAKEARQLMLGNVVFNQARLAGSPQEAVALLRRAVSLCDFCPYFYAELAQALLALGDIAGARQELDHANALPAGYPPG